MGDQTDYPHWKDALFADDKIANLKCAAKYVFWHVSYMLLAIIGVAILGIATAVDKVAKHIPSDRIGSAVSATNSALESSGVKRGARVLTKVLAALFVIGMTGGTAYLVYLEPLLIVMALIILGVAIALLAIMMAVDYLLTKTGVTKTMSNVAVKAGSKAKETPGVRRVYGNCPVHMDLEPAWFDDLQSKFE